MRCLLGESAGLRMLAIHTATPIKAEQAQMATNSHPKQKIYHEQQFPNIYTKNARTYFHYGAAHHSTSGLPIKTVPLRPLA